MIWWLESDVCSSDLFERKEIGAEELSEGVRDSRDRQIDRIRDELEIDRDVIRSTGHDAPGILVGSIPPQRLTARVLRAERMDVARVILNLVVARTPSGQRNEQRLPARGWKF